MTNSSNWRDTADQACIALCVTGRLHVNDRKAFMLFAAQCFQVCNDLSAPELMAAWRSRQQGEIA